MHNNLYSKSTENESPLQAVQHLDKSEYWSLGFKRQSNSNSSLHSTDEKTLTMPRDVYRYI